jgi:hypothetical protein
MTVEDSIANLSGKYLDRYKSVVNWKKRKGLDDPYSHVEFTKDKKTGEDENSE